MEQYSWCHTFILFQSAEEDYANHTDLWEPQWCAEVVWTSCIWLALPFQSHPYGMHTWICNWLLHMAMQHPGRMCCALWQSALGTKVHWKFHQPLGGVCPGGGAMSWHVVYGIFDFCVYYICALVCHAKARVKSTGSTSKSRTWSSKCQATFCLTLMLVWYWDGTPQPKIMKLLWLVFLFLHFHVHGFCCPTSCWAGMPPPPVALPQVPSAPPQSDAGSMSSYDTSAAYLNLGACGDGVRHSDGHGQYGSLAMGTTMKVEWKMFCLWGYPGLAFHMCFANAPLPFEAATGQWLGKSWGWVVVSVWCMMFLFV